MDRIEQLDIQRTDQGIIISVKVVPGSSRDRIVGVLGNSLKITTSTAPERGKANQAVTKTLAKALGINTRNVKLISGKTGAQKKFAISEISCSDVRRKLTGKN